MVFSSFLFLFFFLPAFFALYFATPARLKNLVILVASYLFYGWGAPKILPLFFASCAIDYFLGAGIAKYQDRPKLKRLCLVSSLVLNLGALFYYKYANFLVENVNSLCGLLGKEHLSWVQVALPIGISFFTFHKISYIVDVYRKNAQPAQNFINYALYIALFPQLIAGPIIRYYDIGDQIEKREHDPEAILSGAFRFCLGLGKKVLIADTMGKVADNVLKLDGSGLSTSYAWLGIVCYAYQIYFDFSGYSDMAIGLARIMGFRFLENFNQPYLAQTFTDFWRRWHISLSNWMRDYLYIPLGGNRVSSLRKYLNLWLVFLLSGLWHGASWNFIVWGAYHGFFLAMDKLFWLKASDRVSKWIRLPLTFVLVLVGWVFFRADTLSEAIGYLQHMFGFVSYWSPPAFVPRGMVIHNRAIFVLIVASAIVFLPAWESLRKVGHEFVQKQGEVQLAFFRFASSVLLVFFSTIALATTSFNPFIYFRS